MKKIEVTSLLCLAAFSFGATSCSPGDKNMRNKTSSKAPSLVKEASNVKNPDGTSTTTDLQSATNFQTEIDVTYKDPAPFVAPPEEPLLAPDLFVKQHMVGRSIEGCLLGYGYINNSPVQTSVRFTVTGVNSLIISEAKGPNLCNESSLPTEGPTHGAYSFSVQLFPQAGGYLMSADGGNGVIRYFIMRYAGKRIIFQEKVPGEAAPGFVAGYERAGTELPNTVLDPLAFSKSILKPFILFQQCQDASNATSNLTLWNFSEDGSKLQTASIGYAALGCAGAMTGTPYFSAIRPSAIRASTQPGVWLMRTPNVGNSVSFRILKLLDKKLQSSVKAADDGKDLTFTNPLQLNALFDGMSLNDFVKDKILSGHKFEGCRQVSGGSERNSFDFGLFPALTTRYFSTNNCTGAEKATALVNSGILNLKSPYSDGVWGLTLGNSSYIMMIQANRIVLSLKPNDSGSDLTFTAPLFLTQVP